MARPIDRRDGWARMTLARRALWLSQLLQPDVSHVVAFGITVSGPLDVPLLMSTTHAVLEHVGWYDVHIPSRGFATDDAGAQPIRFDGTGSGICDIHDFSGVPDAEAAADSRMQAFVDAPEGADLTAPLWRSELYVLGSDRYRWVVRAHHVLTDGAGALRVAAHIAEVYAGGACTEGLQVSSAEEISRTENEYRGSRRYEADREYWKACLEHHRPSFLVGIGTRPTSRVTRATRPVSTARPPSPTESISALAGFCARMLDSVDVGLSLPVAARTSQVRRRAIAPLSNVVPLTLNGIGDRRAAEAHRQTTLAVLGVLRHQLFRREDMLPMREDLRSTGVVVNVLPTMTLPDVAGLSWRVAVLRTGPVADVAVSLHPADAHGRATITWEANGNLIDQHDLSALAYRFDRYLAATVDELDGGVPIGERSVFLPGEWPAFRRRMGSPAPRYSATSNLLEDLRDQCGADAAIIDGSMVMTSTELVEHADRVARELVRGGVSPGDPVAVFVERSAASVIAFWAIMRAGAVWVPVDTRFSPEARTREVLTRARIEVGLCAPGKPGPVPIRWIPIHLDELGNRDDPGVEPGAESPAGAESSADAGTWDPPGCRRGPEDGAYLLFTSGSTGRPKAVDMPHRGIPALVAEIRRSYLLGPGDRVLHVSAPTFDNGIVEMVAAVATGATLVVAPATVYGGTALAELIRGIAVTHIIVTPSVLETLPIDIAHGLTQIIVGGEPLPARLVSRWAKHVSMRNAYGPTEARCSINLSRPLRPGDQLTAGPPMVGVVESVLDRHGRAQPPGGIGILHCAGPQLAHGYRDSPDLTAQAFVESTISDDPVMYRTGDVARWTDAGELCLLGRRDRQVKLRGLRIELEEIDAALVGVQGISQSATLLRETVSGTTGLVAFVVPNPQWRPPEVAVLRREVAAVLPSYMVPSSFVIIDELPRTVSGKLDWEALLVADLPAECPRRQPEGAREQLVCGVVADMLGVASVDPDDSFVGNGGDSLSALRIAHVLESAGYSDIEGHDVLACASLADIAARHTPLPDDATPADRRVHGGVERPLTPAQSTVSREPRDPCAQLIRGGWIPAVDPGLTVGDIRSLLQILLARHPGLRSCFPDTEEGPVQQVYDHLDVDSVLVLHKCDKRPDPDMLRRIVEEMSAGLDVRIGPPLAVAALVDADQAVQGIGVVAHHIAVDGQSIAVLASEIGAVTAGRRLAPPGRCGLAEWVPPTPEQLAALRDDIAAESASVWTLSGVTPADCPVGAAIRRSAVIEPDAFRRFAKTAAYHGCTAFEAFRSVVAEVLAEVTGDRRVMSATPTSRRPPDAADAVDNFVISTLIPLDADDDPGSAAVSARERIRRSSVPMEQVLDALDRTADGRHLFAVPLLIGWTADIGGDALGVAGDLYPFLPDTTRWLLQIDGCPGSRGDLTVRLTASDLLSPHHVERILDGMVRAVEGVA